MWGNIPVVASEVDVAPTAPNETCTASVELITPSEPGMYISHLLVTVVSHCVRILLYEDTSTEM